MNCLVFLCFEHELLQDGLKPVLVMLANPC